MYVDSQLFAMRAAEKNIKKARHERCPCADESTQRCSQKRWQAARHVPAAHESHKLEHHDQWARFRFRKAKAVHHLTRLQPVKILGDVLQHGVSAAKRDDGCLAKEQTFPEKRIVPPTPKASEQNRQPPYREPNRADFDGARE